MVLNFAIRYFPFSQLMLTYNKCFSDLQNCCKCTDFKTTHFLKWATDVAVEKC